MQNPHLDQALVTALLTDNVWRERIVEEFVFGAGDHMRVSASFQFALDRELLKDFLPGTPGDHVRVPLPVTTREKRSLLNFDLRGPDGTGCFLLPRDEIGVLQAGYLLDLLAGSGVEAALDPTTPDLLTAICTFTPGLFRSLRTDVPSEDLSMALARYLMDGLPTAGSGFAISPADVIGWRQQAMRARGLLASALDEPGSEVSSSEEVLLALPHMLEPPTDPYEISMLVDRYCELVEELGALETTDPLRALADSGRRWVVIAEITAPVGRRFAVRLSEDRRLETIPAQQRFALGDASSAHLEVRIADSNVRLGRAGRLECRDLLGNEIGLGFFEDARFTPETSSLYSSEAGRPRFVDVYVALQLAGSLRLAPIVVSALAAAAAVISLLLPDGPNLVTSLEVIVLPITVAAALLTVREQTALAARLQKRPQAAVLAATAILWCAVLGRLL